VIREQVTQCPVRADGETGRAREFHCRAETCASTLCSFRVSATATDPMR
jgi:hypothetical protein